jgi:hypothetical protein
MNIEKTKNNTEDISVDLVKEKSNADDLDSKVNNWWNSLEYIENSLNPKKFFGTFGINDNTLSEYLNLLDMVIQKTITVDPQSYGCHADSGNEVRYLRLIVSGNKRKEPSLFESFSILKTPDNVSYDPIWNEDDENWTCSLMSTIAGPTRKKVEDFTKSIIKDSVRFFKIDINGPIALMLEELYGENNGAYLVRKKSALDGGMQYVLNIMTSEVLLTNEQCKDFLQKRFGSKENEFVLK